MKDDHFHDECAVVGLVGLEEAAKYAYLGLYSMQHRGQEGAGIVSSNLESLFAHRDMGLVADVFKPSNITQLEGSLAIGHNRYATFGSKDYANLQPLIANFADNSFAIAHNGNLINATDIRKTLEASGAIFSTTSDTEVILHLIARATQEGSILDKTASALAQVQGAYSLVVMSLKRLIAVRDPHGVRPLALARLGKGYVVASETCAFDLLGATFEREIEPGEILEISADGTLTQRFLKKESSPAHCVFEHIYFSRPDSNISGKNVYAVRKQLGAVVAKEHPVDADLIIPVPDSGVPAAIGYAQESKTPLEFGLIRNHYIGRTFIEPQQSIRDFGVKIKLNANTATLKGKRVVLVDDSIVRGTTCKKIVKMVRQAGAEEVHLRISSPPTTGPCFYGIDTPSKGELIASNHDIDSICEYVGADSLGYLSIDGLYQAIGAPREHHCDACFSGHYRLGTPCEVQERTHVRALDRTR